MSTLLIIFFISHVFIRFTSYNSTNKNEYTYLKEVTLRYIDTVFSDKNVKKLLLVVHPHMKHFTGEYNFYFGDFLKEILQENIFKEKIVLLDFKEIFYETRMGSCGGPRFCEKSFKTVAKNAVK